MDDLFDTPSARAIIYLMSDAVKNFEATRAAIADGEARNLGRTAMAKRWKAFFAAEDAIKARAGGWS